jgi:hypothetical protein
MQMEKTPQHRHKILSFLFLWAVKLSFFVEISDGWPFDSKNEFILCIRDASKLLWHRAFKNSVNH